MKLPKFWSPSGESPKLTLFDELSPDGDSKSGNFIWLQSTVDSWPKTLPMPRVGSWNSTTETQLSKRHDFGCGVSSEGIQN